MFNFETANKKALIINGPEGSGKTQKAIEIAEQNGPYVHINTQDLCSNFQTWLHDDAKTVIVEEPDQAAISRLKEYICNSQIEVKKPYKATKLRKTPNFILIANQPKEALGLGSYERRFAVIEMQPRVNG